MQYRLKEINVATMSPYLDIAIFQIYTTGTVKDEYMVKIPR